MVAAGMPAASGPRPERAAGGADVVLVQRRGARASQWPRRGKSAAAGGVCALSTSTFGNGRSSANRRSRSAWRKVSHAGRPVEQRDMDGEHQQAVLRGALAGTLPGKRTGLAQAADVGGLGRRAGRPRHRARRNWPAVLPRRRCRDRRRGGNCRSECSSRGGIEIEIVVARRMQPGQAELRSRRPSAPDTATGRRRPCRPG